MEGTNAARAPRRLDGIVKFRARAPRELLNFSKEERAAASATARLELESRYYKLEVPILLGCDAAGLFPFQPRVYSRMSGFRRPLLSQKSLISARYLGRKFIEIVMG